LLLVAIVKKRCFFSFNKTVKFSFYFYVEF
jgi:hypothetical protein